MRTTFSLRHALVFVLVLCLISVVAGAALAQEEPSAPEPVVPVFDLTGSSAGGVAEPAAVGPVTIAPAVTGITVDGPTGVITTTDPTWTVNADGVVGTAHITLNVYGPNQYYVDSEGNIVPTGSPVYSEDMTGTGLTETESARITFSPAAFSPMDVVTPPFEFMDGFNYPWQIVVSDDSSEWQWETGQFTIDIPLVSPPLTDTNVIVTTPIITWEDDDSVAWYAVASYVPDGDVLSWFDYYPADDNNEDYGNPRYSEGICENGQCKVRPYQSMSYSADFSEFVDGDFTAQIWVQKFDEDFNIVADWEMLTEFDVVAPDVNVDPDGGETEGRPLFTVTPKEQVVDEDASGLLGMTVAIRPDYYYVFLIPGDDVIDTFDYPDGFAAEWFYAGSPDAEGVQTLWAWDDEQDLLYNGTWTYWVQGYSTRLDAYTNWTLGDTFTINAEAPLAEELVFAGIYEEVGYGGALNPDPWAMTTTWTPAALTSVVSNRPLFHIAPNVGGFSGDWLEIIIYNNDEGVVYDEWLNVNDAETSSDPSDQYWYCDEGFGFGEYSELTCFLQLPEVLEDSPNGGLTDGVDYQLYGASYGPGGFSTGGIFDSGFTDPEDSPAADFTMDGPDALQNLTVDVDGGPIALTRTVTNWWETNYSLPLTNTYVTGEPMFSWDEEETATYIYYEITEGGVLVGGGEWLVVDEEVWCDGWYCYFQPEDYLPNGDYTATFVYWNGGVSDEASIDFSIDNGPASAPAATTTTMFVYVNESLTGTTRPIFNWQHVDGNTWYMVEIQQAGNPIYFTEWYRATDICWYDLTMNEYFYNTLPDFPFYESGYNQAFEFRCNLADSFNELVLDSGDYSWVVWAWSPAENPAAGDASDPADFDLSSTATGEPTAVYPYEDLSLTWTVKPNFYFTPGANAAWYMIYVGSDDLTAVFDWYYISDNNIPDGINYVGYPNNVCYEATEFAWDDIYAGPGNAYIETEGPLCRYFLASDELLLENGSYEWWMMPYGPAGLVDNDTFGWVNVANFTVDIPAPEAVDTYYYPAGWVVTELGSVSWESAEGAMWYNVSITDTASEEEVFNEWIYYEDACGVYDVPDFDDPAFPTGNPSCGIEILDDSFLSEWGVFEISVSAWGQGSNLFGGTEENDYNATQPDSVGTFTKL